MQTITIDPEGEFATLREKFPFVLVGKGGETPADPRSANLLAQRLLELKASAVCDLYDLKSHLRHTWVKNFLEGLIEAPKNLRTPVIVIVDEAHIFCPEKGESEAFGAMVDLCTRGRKRGLCPVWATQRLAMISKDASSQLQNRLVGMQFEDVNRKRAAEMLGVLESDKRAFMHAIQLLEPGNFFALGRAISKERILVQVGGIETMHPKAFEKHVLAPPPAPDKIKALLPKLADLPKEAEDKARSEADFRREIRELRAKLTIAEKASVQTTAAKSVPVADEKAIDRAVKLATAPLLKQLNGLKQRVHSTIGKAAGDLARVSNTLQDGLLQFSDLQVPVPQAPAVASLPSPAPTARSPIAIAPARVPRVADDGDVRLGRIHTEIAGILAGLHPQPIKISILATMVGRVPGGSLFGAIKRAARCRIAGQRRQWSRSCQREVRCRLLGAIPGTNIHRGSPGNLESEDGRNSPTDSFRAG